MARQTAEKHQLEEMAVGGNKRAAKSLPAAKAAPAKKKPVATSSFLSKPREVSPAPKSQFSDQAYLQSLFQSPGVSSPPREARLKSKSPAQEPAQSGVGSPSKPMDALNKAYR